MKRGSIVFTGALALVVSGTALDGGDAAIHAERPGPQTMAVMMEMARRMGDGELMLGMVRMMEMMGSMDGTMGTEGEQ